MQGLAVSLQRALAQREREGRAASGRAPAARPLAAGAGWSVDDVVCTLGPGDRPYEECHTSACLAVVAAGVFGYRSGNARALMTPGALMLGETGACFECGHRHAAGDRCLSFHYDPAWLDEQAAAAGLAAGARRWRAARVPALRALAPLVAHACADALAQERGHAPGMSAAAWDEIALELALTTLRVVASGKDAGTPAMPGAAAAARVVATLRLIDETPDDAHTLASLASAAGVSEFYLLRTFSAVAGVTPHQYLLRARLRAAALRLAADDEAKIVDVALASGFNDLSNFNAAFRTEFGGSPRAWRAAERERHLTQTSWPNAAQAAARA
ncbi:AraC family transcriptional regulator [Paraburkholderia sp. CNPSo 3272]|uniref:helix-turn-helix domain-containing protein n=1 Tax=Paraburkholderia sp. CNPSo 3272 TaxID=2940931 RepID=UPI0020B8839F|nr:AraC family transcriptional regulator [Paraburkholderia sp. CNPSo 3272]MCP3721904.1 AraC family transcriptional regulator [Paraburkholderia sp. CNPSo 3272]